MKKRTFFFYLLFFVGIAVIFLPAYSNMQEKKHRNVEYDLKISELEQTNQVLKEERILLEENPDYLERVAREKMGLIKEGEVLIRIKDSE